MDASDVIGALGALAQDTRLKLFRELVKAHAPDPDEAGLSAGALAKRLGIGASALSFHLKEMQWKPVDRLSSGRSLRHLSSEPR